MPWMGFEFWDVPVWAWLLLPAIFFLAWVVAMTVLRLASCCGKRVSAGREWQVAPELRTIHRPLTLLMNAFLFSAAVVLLPLDKQVLKVLAYISNLLYILSFAGIALRLANFALRKLQEDLIASQRISAAALIPLFHKLSNVAIVIFAFLFALSQWGYDVKALLAALGIGGIAIALASQKSMENLFGGVMLSLDQPIRVGEAGKYGDLSGSVLDIGLRSTKIKTPQNTVVSIPNSTMATLQIESFLPRNQILFNKLLHIRYDAEIEGIQKVRQKIYDMLTAHPKTVKDSPRVRIVDLGEYSVHIDVWSYVNTANWNEYMEVQENFLLEIMRVVRDAGTNFAMPSQPLYEMKKLQEDEV